LARLEGPPVSAWNQIIASFPDPHLLQTWEWGQVKQRFGWRPYFLLWPEKGDRALNLGDTPTLPSSIGPVRAAALLLKRTLPIRGFAARLSVLYVPKGPLLRDWGDSSLCSRVLNDLRDIGKDLGSIFIKIDPDVSLGKGIRGTEQATETVIGNQVIAMLQGKGWRFSEEQVQFRNTVLMDLSGGEEALLARMKQKTRYNVRLAERKGVIVRIGNSDDLSTLYRMYAETAMRDGFTIRDEAYYRHLWKIFLKNGSAVSNAVSLAGEDTAPRAIPLIAEVSGEAVAGLVLFTFARKAWFLYGMSREAHREKMPNYLLQWEAIRYARTAGCQIYDLWGAPDDFNESDLLWGVYRFKEGLGGVVNRTIGAWDLPLRPSFYRLYAQFLPRLLDVMRSHGKARLKRDILN
jgi:lipid II:glycine glycyltransferase (peptidoglycan interpeptide bridge formation enzyme)